MEKIGEKENLFWGSSDRSASNFLQRKAFGLVRLGIAEAVRLVFHRLDFRVGTFHGNGASGISGEATAVLNRLLDSEDERVRLSTAWTVLETGMKTREFFELSQRIDTLEKLTADTGGDGWFERIQHREGNAFRCEFGSPILYGGAQYESLELILFGEFRSSKGKKRDGYLAGVNSGRDLVPLLGRGHMFWRVEKRWEHSVRKENRRESRD